MTNAKSFAALGRAGRALTAKVATPLSLKVSTDTITSAALVLSF